MKGDVKHISYRPSPKAKELLKKEMAERREVNPRQSWSALIDEIVIKKLSKK